MADEENGLSLSDLLAAGSLKSKLLAIVPEVLSVKHKEKLLKEIGEGKSVKEVHTKAGRKYDPPKGQFDSRKCLTGVMKLPDSGEWTCFALWSSDGKLYQGTFQMKVDPDPSKTGLSLKISSPPGTPPTTFTVVDLYFKFDHDGQGGALNIAGELGVSYRDTKDQLRTLMFTTKPNKIVGV